jgi:HPt (histidine-containing phosphotransfer) domain-containing protein
MLVTEFQNRLAPLQRDFREKAPGRIAAIERAWSRARAMDSAADAWQELIALAHGLAGSSTPMGFPALGAAARDLEQAIVLRRMHAGAPTPDEIDRFACLVARLRQALNGR